MFVVDAVLGYIGFSFFSFAQKYYLSRGIVGKYGRRGDRGFPVPGEDALVISTVLSTIVGFVFLIYYAYSISFFGAIVLWIGEIFLVGFIGGVIVAKLIEMELVELENISSMGFVAWPFFAFIMFAEAIKG
ncbi:hypothetical protein CO608_03880 [Lysobacteraceae bacterium NML08-0793]|nr:hypothetical protein CO608_03880 [Xanthomonadaceae bacterium NML08-0793]